MGCGHHCQSTQNGEDQKRRNEFKDVESRLLDRETNLDKKLDEIDKRSERLRSAETEAEAILAVSVFKNSYEQRGRAIPGDLNADAEQDEGRKLEHDHGARRAEHLGDPVGKTEK